VAAGADCEIQVERLVLTEGETLEAIDDEGFGEG
jgi:hypothetical protein